MKSVDKYLELLEIKEELIALNEIDLNSLISKLTPEAKTKAIIKKMRSSVDKKNPVKSMKAIKKILNFVPAFEAKKLDSFIQSKFSGHKSLKATAKTILKNSLPDASDTSIDFASTFLAVSATIAEKGKEKISPRDNLKNRIKEFVIRTRKFMDEHEEEAEKEQGLFTKENLPDLAVGWIIVVMATAFATGIGGGVFLVLLAVSHYPILILSIVLVAITGAALLKIMKAGGV